MATNLVQFGDDIVDLKQVRYLGTDTLRNGYNVCYNRDTGTAADVEPLRGFSVETPSATNLDDYAGVIVSHDLIVGPATVTIAVPKPRGQVVQMWTDASVTVNTTDLYLQAGSYAAGSAGSRRIGRALQTVDRSSTAGTCQALLTGVLLSAGTAQDVGASTTFTSAIWANFPLAEMRANPALGTLLEFDPAANPAAIPSFSKFAGANNSVTAGVKAASLAETDQLVLSHDSGTADNDAVSLQMPGPIVLSGGKPWAMEVEYDLTTVTDADMESFVGLLDLSTLSNVIPYQDGGAFTAASNLVGFNVLVGDGNAIDVSYQAGGETTVIHDAGAGVPTANTAITVALYFDGTDIHVYIDGTSTADPILAADIADLTDVFPVGVTAYLSVAGKGDSGVADGDDINVRAFRVAQLA